MNEEPIRKLAVLLHADVVGSTALVQKNETLAHQRMQDTFRRFAETIVTHGGIAHEIRGDALVAEFPKASDAVAAAVDFQTTNTAHNSALGDDVLAVVRVGIAMGEVVVADNTVTGEGIVLAQRLEQLAEPGGVCIQDAAYQTVPKRLPYIYENLGENRLKGFDDPVTALTVRQQTEESTARPGSEGIENAVTLALPDKPSIAVLPFTNMSSDPEQEHFSDGITEDIITALSRISGLLVIARNSTMVYKGNAVDIKQVGREQGVRHVLEGSVRRIGDRVRVTAQLIEAATGHHLWAERYDRNLDDIFEVQDDLTKKVTTELQVKLATGEEARVWARETSSIAAWERLLKAIPLSDEHVRESNREAQRLAAEATELDPDCAIAWSTLGWTHWEDDLWGWGDNQESSLDVARNCAERAFQIDSEHTDALSLLGCIYMSEKNATKAIELCKRAVRSSPNHASTLALAGLVMIYSGDPDGGLSMMNRAIRLSPIHPVWWRTMIGVVHHLAGDNAKAIEIFRTCVAEEPESLTHREWIVSALVEVGDTEEVKEHVKFILETEPDFSSSENVNSFSNYDDLTNKFLKNLSMAGLPP